MTDDVVISAEGLGKKYMIGHHPERERYTALRDVIARGVKSLARSARNLFRGGAILSGDEIEEFWALRDVSFEVKRGEVIGIIGRNGAGKSTLLKILSRITEPSEGRVTIKDRVASLLEVGTGFHPELSGRENIYLNGAILGMTRAEIKRKFDEIVAFAEVEKFLDTPVKRYSSGMYVRLAFSVAAHLEPEILIVDEVLAVGDAEFQRKCIGKMRGVASTEGRSILFVSHNMMAIKQLCHRGIWLHNGQIRNIGAIDEIVEAYSVNTHDRLRSGSFLHSLVRGDGQVELVSYAVSNPNSENNLPPATKDDLLFRIDLRVKEEIRQPACGISIFNEFGVLMTSVNTVELGTSLPPLPAGHSTVCVRIRQTVFLPGTYTASFWVMSPQGHIHAMAENSIVFEIAHAVLYGTSQVDHKWGCVYSDVDFSVQPTVRVVESRHESSH
jgi:lipopolysaccharide transport system ATP-binding protein